MARYTIDRFEGAEWAVLEDGQARTFRVPRQWVPSEAREGDVLAASEEHVAPGIQTLRFEIDAPGREERDNNARRLRDQLPRGPKGDISL